MSELPDILLLADQATAQRLTASMPAMSIAKQADPFAALEALSQHPYQTVLVAVPQPDLPELLRMIRKLQPESHLYGLCTPVGEYELRSAGDESGRLMEDYFIIPPTPAEWRRIIGPPAETVAMAEAATSLSTRQISDLVEAAAGPETLARCVAQLTAEACDCQVRWSGDDGRRAGVQQLLTLDLDPPRTLWAADALDPNQTRQRWLSALRAQLPSLAATARRTAILRRMATTDHLTGAHNRRYFMHFAERMLQTVRQRRQRATLLLYDIDDFKVYNDSYGHAAGDEILRETAILMQQITRKHDLVARVGGDEFAVLFCELEPSRQPGSQPLQTAFDLANRFRKAVSSHSFQALGLNATGTLTISGGLATFPWDGFDITSLLQRADDALLTAKASGKNNIYLIGDTPPET